MKSLFSRIQRSGLENLKDPLTYRRALFINNLSIACTILCALVTILLISAALFPQNLLVGTAGLLFLVPPFLNASGRLIVARLFFVFLSALVVFFISLAAYAQARMIEQENLLIALMAATYLLFDGRLRYVSFLSVFAVMIVLKLIKHSYAEGLYDFNFYLMIQNNVIICILLFLFADSFRTSLLRSYQLARARERELYSMIDNIPLFIGLIDSQMRYLMVNLNYQKAFGMDREKIIGSKIDDVLPQSILSTHKPMVQAALAGESPDFLEHTEMPDGSSFYASGKYIPVKNARGEVIAASVFVSDVSKLEIAKNQLKEANQTKNRLFSIVAHDIRGPLDMFQTLLSVTSEGAISQDQFMDHQNTVKEKLRSLRVTVDTLLDWARTQLDGIHVTPQVTEIEGILQENKRLFGQLMEQKKLSFDTQIPAGLKAWVDSNHLKIILRNLIHNAIKFSPSNGRITISVRQAQGYVEISISDQGQGMEQAQIDSILAMQVQHSKSGTAGEGGIGLGLSLSMGLLEKNKCNVEINSTPGRGTEVKMSIPKAN